MLQHWFGRKATAVVTARCRRAIFRLCLVRSNTVNRRAARKLLVKSEAIFQAELHGACAVRVNRMQESAPRETTGIARRVVWATVATNRVAGAIAEVGIVDAKLGVVENIESLAAKFEVAALSNLEVFEHGDIEV